MPEETETSIDRWLKAAIEDAAGRGLPALGPLLEGLARATAALRRADWAATVSRRIEPQTNPATRPTKP